MKKVYEVYFVETKKRMLIKELTFQNNMIRATKIAEYMPEQDEYVDCDERMIISCCKFHLEEYLGERKSSKKNS